MGFKSLKLSVNGGTLINLTIEGENGPVVELAVGPTSDLPTMLELVAGAILTPPAPLVQNKDKKIEVRSTIEKGSSNLGALFGTKSARKNYLTRVSKKIAKSRKIAEQKALSLVDLEATEEFPVPPSSPLLKGSHFYPLVAAVGEERVVRITSSPPSSVDYSVKRTTKEKHTLRTRMLRNNIHICAAKKGQTKEQYVRHPVEDVTLTTTNPSTVRGEGIVLDDDQEMLDQLVVEPTADYLNVQEVLAKLGNEEFEEIINYKLYLPISIESIKGRPVDEVVQEIRDILNKMAIEAFDPKDDDLMEEHLARNICMVETRASNKYGEPSRHRSDKEGASVAIDSDFDGSIKLNEKDEYIESLESKIE
ncbi:hypothetical protein IEQ34_021615 [Dendrobium chrysotoxum]|uniref:Uncharacterized protein n=1 Tax=Dendrobium chrysotoxum TaxID=161865 RepID=A0AAV7G5D1_DENCH|nr:hypothetical protein IEQ34_021615 [Dendrobium chrysotoxum]